MQSSAFAQSSCRALSKQALNIPSMNQPYKSFLFSNRSSLTFFSVIFALSCILPISDLSAKPKELKSWSELKKVPKPSHEGIQEKLMNSHIYLNAGSSSLRVPADSLLHIPAHFTSRVTPHPEFKLVSWQTFLSANHSWLRACPVSWAQVTGKTNLPKSVSENFETSPFLTIATFRQSPISFNLKEDLPTLSSILR